MKNILNNRKIKRIIRKLKNLSKYDKKVYIWIGFFIFAFILFLNIIFMMLQLLDSDYQYRLLDKSYIDAVLPEQDLDQPLTLRIVKVKEPVMEDLKVGDEIVIYGDYDLNVYWIETIVSVSSSEVQATYDQLLISTFQEEDIMGVYVKDANFMGTIYYSASYLEGFIFLTTSHVFLLSGYYYFFLSKKEGAN